MKALFVQNKLMALVHRAWLLDTRANPSGVVSRGRKSARIPVHHTTGVSNKQCQGFMNSFRERQHQNQTLECLIVHDNVIFNDGIVGRAHQILSARTASCAGRFHRVRVLTSLSAHQAASWSKPRAASSPEPFYSAFRHAVVAPPSPLPSACAVRVGWHLAASRGVFRAACQHGRLCIRSCACMMR